jgi:hypothetical protein
MKIYIITVRRECEECEDGYTFVQWATDYPDLCGPLKEVAIKYAEQKLRTCPECGTYLKTAIDVNEQDEDKKAFLGFGQIHISWDDDIPNDAKPMDDPTELFGTWPGEKDDDFEESVNAMRKDEL